LNIIVGFPKRSEPMAETDFFFFWLTAGFRPNMKQAVDALLGEKLGSEVQISLGKDGSGVGAGVIAALA